MFSRIDQQYFVRTVVYACYGIAAVFLVALIRATVQGTPNNSEGESLSALVGFMSLLLAIITGPGISGRIERVFKARLTEGEEVRKTLKKRYVDRLRYADEGPLEKPYPPSKARRLAVGMSLQPGLLARSNLGLGNEIWDSTRVRWLTSAEYDSTRLTAELDKVSSQEQPLVYIWDVLNSEAERARDVADRTEATDDESEYSRPHPHFREHILLLGQQGSGKTVALLELAGHILESRDARVPVYLSLFSWASACKKIESWLEDQIDMQYELTRWEAQRMIKNNGLILLLDDFETIPQAERRHFTTALTQFLSRRHQQFAHQTQQTLHSTARSRSHDVIVLASEKESGSNEPLQADIEELRHKVFPLTLTLNDFTANQLRSYLAGLRDSSNNRLTSPEYQEMLVYWPQIANTPQLLSAGLAIFRSTPESLTGFNYRPSPPDTLPQRFRQFIARHYNRARLSRMAEPMRESARDDDTLEHFYDVVPLPGRSASRLVSFVKDMVEAIYTDEPDNREEPKRIFYAQDVTLADLASSTLVTQEFKAKISELTSRYRGLVTLVTLVLLLGVFLLFFWPVIDSPHQPVFLPLSLGLIVLFSRWYSWRTCAPPTQQRFNLRKKVRWFNDAGWIAGIVLGVLAALIFREVAVRVYGAMTVNGTQLFYETLVIGLFSIILFRLLGGLDVGRARQIVAFPGDGVNSFAVALLLATLAWILFFFLFMVWPRTLADAFRPEDLRLTIQQLIEYSIPGAIFLGFTSGLLLFHNLLRQILLLLVLRRWLRYSGNLTTSLKYLVELRVLGRIGGGYYFISDQIAPEGSHAAR
jgi:hypothetical protein